MFEAFVRDPSARWFAPGHRVRFLSLSLSLWTIIVYAHTLFYPFVWDDEGLVTRNPHVRSLSNLAKLFTQDLYWGKGGDTYYRPVQAVTDTVNYFLFGLHAWGYHLTNVLLHAAAAVLLFVLFDKLTKKTTVAFVAAAIWAVHPVQPEAITYIAGRADSLSAIFVLATVLLHIRAEEEGIADRARLYRVASWLSFALAMWSKEIGFVAVPLVVWADLRREGKLDWQKLVIRCLPLVVVVLAYTAARAYVLPSLFGGTDDPQHEGHPLGLLAFPLGLLYGVRLLVFPHPLYMERLAPGLGADGVPVAFVSLVVCVGVGALLWRIRDKRRDLVFSALFYAIALVPLLILFRMNRLFLEHWLYLPSYGATFCVVAAAAGLGERALRDLKIVVCGCVLLVLVVLTVNQNRVWSDPIVLYRHVLQYSPWSRRTHYNLGLAYFDLGLLDEADREYTAARNIFPSRELDGSIALLRAAQKRPDDALKAFNEVLEKNPNQPIYLNNRASVYYAKGKKKEALADIEKAIALDPNYRDAWFNLGVVSKDLKDAKRTREAFERAMAIQVDGAAAVELAQIYMGEKEIAKAFSVLEKAVQADPNSAAAVNFLGVLYAQSQNYGQAEATWRKGLARHPEDPNLRANLERLGQMMQGRR